MNLIETAQQSQLELIKWRNVKKWRIDTRCRWEFCSPTSALSNELLISSIDVAFGTLSVKMA
jgi:hypothetical protein